MKALLVDDERLARNELRRLLADFPEIEIVGEAATAAEAAARVAEWCPDVVFLDVEMPGGLGVDLARALAGGGPRVIFTTAYEDYAARAFEVDAVDYLLKPIDPRRLATAVERLARLDASGSRGLPPEPPLTAESRVLLTVGAKSIFVPLTRILLLEADGNGARADLGGQSAWIGRSLNALEARLPAAVFFRANRRQIINLEAVETVEKWFSGGLRLTLRGVAESVEVTRRQAQVFRKLTTI